MTTHSQISLYKVYEKQRGEKLTEQKMSNTQCAASAQKRLYPQADQGGETGRESRQRTSIHDAASGIKDFQL